jgi:hypothetical protein
LDINGKVIPLGTSHKGTQDSRKKWGGFKKEDVELNSPLRYCICSNIYYSYVSFNEIMLIKMVYMSMGT